MSAETSIPPDTERGARPIGILLVDDHDIVREGLTALLSREPDMHVVGSVSTGDAAVLEAARLHPQVVVMDLMLPTLNGIEATKQILADQPLTHVIALSACHTSEHLHRALQAGARGYVTKTSAGADLVEAIRSVLAGDRYISEGIRQPPGTGLGEAPPERSFMRALERARARSPAPSGDGAFQHRDRAPPVAFTQVS